MANDLLSSALASSVALTQLRNSGAFQAGDPALETAGALIERLAHAPIDVDRCIAEGCNGLPAGLPPQCFDPEKISSYGPPIKFKNPLVALGCTLAAANTSEGRARIDAARARMGAAVASQRRAVDDAWQQLVLANNSWNNGCQFGASERKHFNDRSGYPAISAFGLVFGGGATERNIRCNVFMVDQYEFQRAAARYFKLRRSQGVDLGSAQQIVDWCIGSIATVSMAIQALNIYPNGILAADLYPDMRAPLGWLAPTALIPPERASSPLVRVGQQRVANGWRGGTSADPYMRMWYPTFEPSQTSIFYAQSATLDRSSLFAGLAPSTSLGRPGDNAMLFNALVDIAVPATTPNGGVVPEGRALYGSLLDFGRSRNAAIALVTRLLREGGAHVQAMMDDVVAWLDWLLALPNAEMLLRDYVQAWLRVATMFGPGAPVSLGGMSDRFPMSWTDYGVLRAEAKALTIEKAVSSVAGVISTAVGVFTMNPGAVADGLSNLASTFISNAMQAPTPYSLVRPIPLPFMRWLQVKEFNLETSSPETQPMMARVVEALVRYQTALGMNWGLNGEPDTLPPIPDSAPLPPPIGKVIPWGPILIGAAVLGGGAILYKVLR